MSKKSAQEMVEFVNDLARMEMANKLNDLSEIFKEDTLERGLLHIAASAILSDDWVKIDLLEYAAKLFKKEMEANGEFNEDMQKSFEELMCNLESRKEKL